MTKSIGPEYGFLHFGTLVNNEHYQIYRSRYLGKTDLTLLQQHLKSQQAPFPKTIIYMNTLGYKFPFYFALDEYKAQDAYSFKFYHSFGQPRTYLDGTNPYDASTDIDAESLLGRHARRYFNYQDDQVDGDIQAFLRILQLILDPQHQPVLFHCHGGVHRTGMVAMTLRYLQGGKWTDQRHYHKRGMIMNLAEYEYYSFNRLLFRKENIYFVRQFSESDAFAALKTQYRQQLQVPKLTLEVVSQQHADFTRRIQTNTVAP